MKVVVKTLISFLIFSSLNFIYAQDKSFDSVVTTGIKQIYSIKFSEAEKTFRGLMADYPNHPAGRFFIAMIDWWKIILDVDDEKYDDLFFQKLEDVIYQCDQILAKDDKNVDALFFKGGAIGFRGRLRALRDSWLKAADDGREALPIVQRAAKLDPNNKDVELGLGIYNYYASVIPEKYPLVKPLMIFFPKGDKEKGIQQLNNTALNGKYAKYEAQYFLMTLYYDFEENFLRAAEYSKVLYNEFPDNPVFERWHGRIAIRNGDRSLTFNVFYSVHQKYLKKYPGYNDNADREASYYLGLDYKDKFLPDSAKYYFEICEHISREIDKEEPSGFLINTLLYLGMMNDLLGNRERAVKYYKEVLEMKEYGLSKDLAKQYLEKPFSKN
jgi:tetratricopeptide (TPR) repeat protein